MLASERAMKPDLQCHDADVLTDRRRAGLFNPFGSPSDTQPAPESRPTASAASATRCDSSAANSSVTRDGRKGLQDELRLREAPEQGAEFALIRTARQAPCRARSSSAPFAQPYSNANASANDPDAAHERTAAISAVAISANANVADGERRARCANANSIDAPGDLHRTDQRADEHRIARGEPARGEQADEMRRYRRRDERGERECRREPEERTAARRIGARPVAARRRHVVAPAAPRERTPDAAAGTARVATPHRRRTRRASRPCRAGIATAARTPCSRIRRTASTPSRRADTTAPPSRAASRTPDRRGMPAIATPASSQPASIIAPFTAQASTRTRGRPAANRPPARNGRRARRCGGRPTATRCRTRTALR